MTSTISKRKPTKVQGLAAIKALRGILRLKAGDASAEEARARMRAEDRAIEERHEALLAGIGANRRRRASRGF